MELQVNRWGNSLAVRLPQELVRQLGLHEGDKVQAEALGRKHLGLSVNNKVLQKRKQWLLELQQLHEGLPVTQPISRDELGRY
jgi:antitoxin MazE